jgi:hypothetical protein
MPVVAGPVFTEWYWGPLFAVLLFGPPVSGVAALLYVAFRRRLPGGRAARIVGAYALSTGLVVGGWAVVRAYRFETQETREARALGFPLFQPRDGRGFDVTRTEVYAGINPTVHWTIERGGTSFFATEAALADADLTPPRCGTGRAHVARGGGFADDPCTAARTPAGRPVALAREARMPFDRYLFADIGGTLLALSTLDTPDAQLLAYVDALEPVTAGNIDYEP